MDISTCTFNLFYQPVPTIRRSVFEIEDRFVGYVKPFQVYSIPDDAPFELARISATSEHGHSNLNISAQSAQVQSGFDDLYSSDANKCLDYSRRKAHELRDALSSIENIEVQFAGLAVQLLLSSDELGLAPVDFITKNYSKVSSGLPIADASAKFVYNIDDGLYLNLEIQRVVLSDPISISISSNGVSITKSPQSGDSEKLSISIDFNNRLAFNSGFACGCDAKMIDSFYDRVSHFLDDGVDRFLSNGEVDF